MTGELSSLVLAAGLIVFLVTAPRDFRAATRLLMEFLLAVGLLRLSSLDSFAAIGAVAAIVAIRQIIRIGLASAPR